MNIIGPDALFFGVDDIEGCTRYLLDFGLQQEEAADGRPFFTALDGTGIILSRKDDRRLPPPLASGNLLRQTVYGVADEATLAAIETELARDRRVERMPDGSIEATDDLGFALAFRVTTRRSLSMPAEKINAPGAPAQRLPNELGVRPDADPKPRTLSHVVYFVPDLARAQGFYAERLGFRVTDTLLGAGPFLRPGGNPDHHTLFFIQTPPYMQGCEHLAFHMGGPSELMLAGYRFTEAGYQSFWGPGRHKFGSNWFWYFNSPFGCHFEYDADMDQHDEAWEPREAPFSPEASQVFLFQYREKWMPGGGPPPGAAR
ncbi:VOC family protein [Acidisoma sp. 7E03]